MMGHAYLESVDFQSKVTTSLSPLIPVYGISLDHKLNSSISICVHPTYPSDRLDPAS
jgi:hypothetical protein